MRICSVAPRLPRLRRRVPGDAIVAARELLDVLTVTRMAAGLRERLAAGQTR